MIDDSVLKPITDLGEMENHGCLPDWLCVGVGLVWWGELRSSTSAQPVFPFLFEWQLALVFPLVTYKNVRLPQGHFLGFCPSNPPPGVTLLSGNSVACSGASPCLQDLQEKLSFCVKSWTQARLAPISHASTSKSKPGGGSGIAWFPFVQAVMTAFHHTHHPTGWAMKSVSPRWRELSCISPCAHFPNLQWLKSRRRQNWAFEM